MTNQANDRFTVNGKVRLGPYGSVNLAILMLQEHCPWLMVEQL